MDSYINYVALLSTFLFIYMLDPIIVVHGATTSVCSEAPYPQLCHSLKVSKKTNKETTILIGYRDSALSAAMVEAVQVHRLISTMDTDSFEDRAKLAWVDCLELYEDSIDLLNRSILSLSNKKKDNNDVQTYLSAALTNHETCQDGFADFNLSATYLKFFPLDNFAKLLSNTLAINKAVMASYPSSLPSKKISKGRRLLDNDLPEWISASDRKLLEAKAPPVDLVVAQDGSGNFTTISEAVAAVKTVTKRFVIYVKKGVYRENVEIKKLVKNLTLFGDGIDATIITGSRCIGKDFTTFGSATFG